METLQYLQRLMLQSRRFYALAVALALVVLALTIFAGWLLARSLVRQQITHRDAELLYATTLMEQCIVLRGVKKLLDAKGIELARSMAGEYLTVQEMGGFQMCIAKLDDELIELFDAPCDTPAWTVK